MRTISYQTTNRSMIVFQLILASTLNVFSQVRSIQPTEIISSAMHDLSPALIDMPQLQAGKKVDKDEREVPNPNYALIYYTLNGPAEQGAQEDIVLQENAGTLPPFSTLVNIEGISNISGYIPPDPAGDIGANHYIQAINLSFAIYSKTGELLYGPAALGSLWQGFPGYQTSDGDPVVFYDHLADRWIITQFSLPNYPNGPFYELIAVSQTPEPLGAWYRYSFQFSKMPDYPKFGVWSDGYYMSANYYSSGALAYTGPAAIVLERDSLLVGKPARMTVFELSSERQPLLPADLDGPPPPVGSLGYFLSANDDPAGTNDHLELFSLQTDWTNPANSFLSGPYLIDIAAFDGSACNEGTNCIPQAGTTRRLNPLTRYLMNRLQYRNFGSYQVLMANHTVDVDGTDHAGIRWYELRTSDTTWSVYQQGTYAPDTNYRWTGSIAMDGTGNIALAYSVSGADIYPSIRATGRRAGDSPGYMSFMEESIMEGTGSQKDPSSRWGDYSCLTVDPVDDKTFWYTNEYYVTTSNQDWKTRIASFSIDDLPVGTKHKTGEDVKSVLNFKIYPNPVNFKTTLTWYLEDRSQCIVKLYNMMGKEIITLRDEIMTPGEHQVTFDASRLPAGIYFYQLQANGIFESKKMVLCQ